MVDYVDGRIITSNIIQTPAYIDYYWNYVSVVDEWLHIEAADAPVVVLDIQGTDKQGYQLGGGRLINRKANIHIFASSSAERKDISEVLYDGLYLKGCVPYTFEQGSVLDFDGTFYGRKENTVKEDYLFSRERLPIMGNLMFEEVSARNVGLPMLMSRGYEDTTLSKLNGFRAKITFNLASYTAG